MRLVFACFVLAVAAPAADAALRICNPHEDLRTVALGYRDGPAWVSEGWWNIAAGDCATVLGGDLSSRYYHYFENRPGFKGDTASRDLCVQLDKFSVRDQADCDASVHTDVRFKRIDVGGKVKDFGYDLPAPFVETTMARSMLWYSSVAAEPPDWGTAGDWSIHIAETLDKSRACFAVKMFPDGTVFRVGLDPWKPDRFLYAFGNDTWASLTRDEDYELSVRFPGRATWTIGAVGRSPASGWGVFLVHRSGGTEFTNDFRLGNTMTISYNNREIARLSLSGTTNAVAQVNQCQDAEGTDGGGTTGGGNTSNDPFAD